MPFSPATVRHLLIDLDGVLYRGDTALPGAADFIIGLRRQGITFRLVTNNATLTPEQYVAKLAAMQIEIVPEELFSSSLATALLLRTRLQRGRRAFVIGEEGLRTALLGIEMELTDDHPEWVVVGLDRQLTYATLATAALAIAGGAHFIGTNGDRSFPTERGLVPGAGAIQAALTATTGIEPELIGKPEPLMLRLAMEALGGTTDNTAMLGDRLDTDILGAHRLDMASIMVLTGVSTRDDLTTSSAQPTLVVKDLAELARQMHLPHSDAGPSRSNSPTTPTVGA